MFITGDDVNVPASSLNDELNVPLTVLQGHLGAIEEDTWDMAQRTPYQAMAYRMNAGLGSVILSDTALITGYKAAKARLKAQLDAGDQLSRTEQGRSMVGSGMARLAIHGKASRGDGSLGMWPFDQIAAAGASLADAANDMLVGSAVGSTAATRDSVAEYEQKLAAQAAQKQAEAEAARQAAAVATSAAEKAALLAAAEQAERIAKSSGALSLDAAKLQNEVRPSVLELASAGYNGAAAAVTSVGAAVSSSFQALGGGFSSIVKWAPWIGAGVAALYLMPQILKIMKAAR